jgi:hypothetical protein
MRFVSICQYLAVLYDSSGDGLREGAIEAGLTSGSPVNRAAIEMVTMHS